VPNPEKKEGRAAAALTVRLPADLHEQVRLYSLFSRRSINDLVTTLLGEWMQEKGHDELIDLMAARGLVEHRTTLNELRNHT
jgi:hypothetical protein